MDTWKYQNNNTYQNDIYHMMLNNIHSNHPNKLLQHLYNQESNRLVYLENYYPELINTTIPRPLNILKSFYVNRKHVINYVNELKKYYYSYFHLSRGNYLGKSSTTYFYKFTLTSNNTATRNLYKKYSHQLVKLNQNKLIKHGVRILTFKNITKFNNLLHSHGLLISNHLFNIPSVEYMSDNYLDIPNCTLRIKPLINFDTHNQVIINNPGYRISSNYQSIQQWLMYSFKSNKLPFLSHSKDLDKWNQVSNKTRYIIHVLINTQHQRTSYMYSFKRKYNNLCKYMYLVQQLSMIYFKLALYGVSEQLVMINLATIPKHSELHSNLYKSSKTNKYALKKWDVLIQNQDKHITNQILKYINQINIYSNHKSTPDPIDTDGRGKQSIVPLVIQLKVTLGNLNKSISKIEQNKKLTLFNSS